ncbi:MAG TPA: M48 family metalloprotease [Baekduia sp.]|nr:M48 family metalloprotease [Baekduia sp.]
MQRRRDLFPADRGLQARMVLAAVLTPTVVLALLALCVMVLPARILVGLGLATLLGVGAVVAERRRTDVAHLLAPGEEPGLRAIVTRLCVVADLPEPEIAVDEERQPNSWIVDAPGRAPRLHVTRGLLELLEPAELEAVVAHELSHVVNRDATVMTVVGLPGAVLLRGGGANVWFGLWLMAGRLVGTAIGTIAAIGSNTLSRYRELTADAGAVALTGRPSALASALMKVSGALVRVPGEDLRAVAARDALHLLPVETATGWRRALHATHPTVERRLAALARLEHELQHARPTHGR